MTKNERAWDEKDREAFEYHTNVMKRGQVTKESGLGQWIHRLASHPRLFRFMEIGTWNGLGSTKCFDDGFQQRRGNDDFSLDSLESNSEKLEIARRMYRHRSKYLRFHHRVITHDIPPFDTIVKDLEIDPKDREGIKEWHHIDTENAQRTLLFVPPFRAHRMYDVILLDGGECTTYYEFKIVKEWTNILLLDDTNTYKCRRVVQELQRDPEWVECSLPSTEEDHDNRNGYACFQRRDFHVEI